jgi:hypothetical protein
MQPVDEEHGGLHVGQSARNSEPGIVQTDRVVIARASRPRDLVITTSKFSIL